MSADDTSSAAGAAAAWAKRLGPPPGHQVQAAKEFRRALRGARAREGAPVRRLFASDETSKPPLACLLSGPAGPGGGRGGQLRVKVLISLLWVCSSEPFTTRRPASAFAALLGLPAHQENGARRVSQALRDLADRDHIRLIQRGGHSPEIVLLNELRDGSAYESPVEMYNTLSRRGAVSRSTLRRHQYFRVPTEIWTEGWIYRMSGPALAMYLVMLAERTDRSPEVWFSPSRAEARFGMAASTRKKAIKELQELGAITTTSRKVSETGRVIDESRRRNVYTPQI